MSENEMPNDRIGEYLRQLTCEARARLLDEMERLHLCGEDFPDNNLILATLRAEFRKGGRSQDRFGNAARYFFQPLEPVLVDSPPEHASCGQISRGSLQAIWEWISRSSLPSLAREYSERMEQAVAAGSPGEAQQLAAAFQTKVAKYLEVTLATENGAAQVRAGLAIYTSSRAVMNDLTKMLAFLRARQALAAFLAALPPRITTFEGKRLGKVRNLLDTFKAGDAKALPFALTMVASRLKNPWQLIRVATKAANSKDWADIAATPYAIAVPLVLHQLDDKRLMLRKALRDNHVSIAKDILSAIYEIEYALRVRIDQLDESDWGRRLNDLMEAIADLVTTEVQSIPSETRHVLCSPKLRRHNSLSARLTYLAWKSRDAVANGASFCRRLMIK
jgi:hypothetical protein